MPFAIPIFLQVMVATVRCEEIANEKYSIFAANEVYGYIVFCFFFLPFSFLLISRFFQSGKSKH
jgi:hypothetical protein